jgi:hypothetical protein
MSKYICFINTETNGEHELDEDICKKNLFGFARLLILNYEIGYKEDKFISILKKQFIVKPRNLYIYEDSCITNEEANEKGTEIELILNTFINDINNNNVEIIIAHDINHHLKALYGEYIRYNIPFSFSKFIIVDTMTFYHSLDKPILKTLYKHLFTKFDKTLDKLTLIQQCFFKLYDDYEKN